MRNIINTSLSYVLILIVFISCTRPGDNDEELIYKYLKDIPVEILKINYNAPNNVLNSNNIEHVLLENSDESLFTQIDKIIFRNNKYYILDVSGIHHVFIFDKNGNFISKVGNRGFGMGEYKMLCDFDVDTLGNVYLYDRQNMQILIHNESGELLSAKKTTFRADGFNLIRGGYIFSLAKNSVDKKTKDFKVITTNQNLDIVNKYFKYYNNYKDDKGNTGVFTNSKIGIVYNKPVDRNIVIFDFNGVPKQHIILDYGKHDVSPELMNSYTDVINNRIEKELKYMYLTPFYINGNIIGNMITKDQKSFFSYDINKRVYTEVPFYNEKKEFAINHNLINLPISVINDSLIVSYLDPQILKIDSKIKELPKDVLNHINTGGIVLSLYHIK